MDVIEVEIFDCSDLSALGMDCESVKVIDALQHPGFAPSGSIAAREARANQENHNASFIRTLCRAGKVGCREITASRLVTESTHNGKGCNATSEGLHFLWISPFLVSTQSRLTLVFPARLWADDEQSRRSSAIIWKDFMITVVGIFEQPNAAGKAVLDLRILGIEHKNIDLLSPGVSEARLAKVPTADSESPGMAGTMGTVLGGAVGVAGGFSLGVAASFMLPGVGPVLALGSLGAAVLGLAGGIGGHAAGESLDRTLLEGLPKDELFLYEDALRQGRSVVLCLAQTELEADEARRILAREGAESIDAARHRWWLGLLDLVREHYNPPSPETDAHEDPFRQGFEAALNPEFRGKPWDQVVYLLAEQYRDWSDDRFRRGFERGQRFHSELMAQPQHV
jgi:hypothetical protein